MNDNPTVNQTGLRYGLITAAVLVAYSLTLEISDLSSNKGLGYVSYLILILGIVWAHRDFKLNGDGFLSYGQGLKIGTVISAICGFLGGVFSYLYLKLVDDSSLEIAMEEARAQLENEGLDDELIDQSIALTEQFLTPGWLGIIGFISMLILGFIFSLIISAATKNNNPDLEI